MTTGWVRRVGGVLHRGHLVALATALLATVGAVAVAPTASAASCTYPAQVLNLTNWKLQTPFAKSDGSPGVLEIKQPALATYRKSPNFVVRDSSNCSAGVTFRAPVNGVTTSGSKYPRTELREMMNNGRDNASWSSTVGTHTFSQTIAFVKLPKVKQDIVGMQIHNASEDISLLVLRGTNLYFSDGDNTKAKLITSNYQLGTKLNAKYVVSNGQTKAYINGVLQLTINRAYDGAYFKAGAYPQANCTNSSPCSSDNYGSAVITKLSLSHTSSLTSALLGPMAGMTG